VTPIPVRCLEDPQFCIEREDRLRDLFAEWRELPDRKRAAFYAAQTPDAQEALDFHCAMVARWVIASIEQWAEDWLAAQREAGGEGLSERHNPS
jgi:hypothetical protein